MGSKRPATDLEAVLCIGRKQVHTSSWCSSAWRLPTKSRTVSALPPVPLLHISQETHGRRLTAKPCSPPPSSSTLTAGLISENTGRPTTCLISASIAGLTHALDNFVLQMKVVHWAWLWFNPWKAEQSITSCYKSSYLFSYVCLRPSTWWEQQHWFICLSKHILTNQTHNCTFHRSLL